MRSNYRCLGTVEFLRRYCGIGGDFPLHDHSANDVHYDPQKEVENSKVHEDPEMPVLRDVYLGFLFLILLKPKYEQRHQMTLIIIKPRER